MAQYRWYSLQYDCFKYAYASHFS